MFLIGLRERMVDGTVLTEMTLEYLALYCVIYLMLLFLLITYV